MLILDRNSYDLLSYLIKLEEPETVMRISKALSQSRRKVYYHLEKINAALPASLPEIISYPRVGILLTQEQKEACQELLLDLDDYSYVMSISERILLTLIYIAIADKRVTIEALMTLNAVSRNTVLNDLNEIRQELTKETRKVSLQVTKSQGYFLECHLLVKIQFLNKLLQAVYQEHNSNFQQLLQEKMRQSIQESLYMSSVFLDFISAELKGVQPLLGKKINPKDVQIMAETLPYHLLAYRNLGLSEVSKMALRREFCLVQQRKEYDIAQELNKKVAQTFAVEWDVIERSLVAVLLLSYRKDKDSHLASHDYDDMRQMIASFLSALEVTYQIRFKHKQTLLDQLLMHCKALIFRKTFGILADNPLTDQIKEKYADLFAMTKSHISMLEKAWHLSMNDDDIAYITIHIGGELVNSKTSPIPPTTLLLICDEGVAIQKIFAQQCQTHLPHSKIEAILSTEQYESVKDLITVDLILSTNERVKTDLPTLFLHSILTDDDIVKLIRFAQSRGQADKMDLSQKLEVSIRQYVKSDQDAVALKYQIERLISEDLCSQLLLTK